MPPVPGPPPPPPPGQKPPKPPKPPKQPGQPKPKKPGFATFITSIVLAVLLLAAIGGGVWLFLSGNSERDSLSALLDDVMAERDGALAEAEETADDMAQLESDLSAAKRDNASLQQEADDLRLQVDDLMAQLDTLSSEMDDLLESTAGAETNAITIGNTLSTYFFDFTVLEAVATDSYAGYTPGNGNKLILVAIETTNTFGQSIPMYETDSQLQWGTRTDTSTYADTLDPLDDACAPIEFDLGAGESMAYLYVYEAPADVYAFEICYLEQFADVEEDGEIHYVAFTV
jgi:uncharacterized membrane protein